VFFCLALLLLASGKTPAVSGDAFLVLGGGYLQTLLLPPQKKNENFLTEQNFFSDQVEFFCSGGYIIEMNLYL
jgi:hypothetical protein